MHLRPEEVVPPLLRMGSAVASVVSMLVGLLVLVGGWGFDLEAIKAVVPGLATMKANTALAFALGGAALWALRDEAASLWKRALGVGAACAMGVLAGLTLAESLTGAELRIDESWHVTRSRSRSVPLGECHHSWLCAFSCSRWP
jgi:hypothetical protein